MRVLVTGASGLIGRHTVPVLLEHNTEVRTFQRSSPGDITVEHVAGDVTRDRAELCRAASGCAAVIHLAGKGDVAESRRDPSGYAELNASGTLHALEAARHAGAAFVLASTQRVYPLQPTPCREDLAPRPDSPYGYAKWVAELWCRMASEQYGLPTTVLRFFSVYGPGQQANGASGVVTIFATAALKDEPLIVQSHGRRDFTHAQDAARAICLAVQQPAARKHRVYNIATGQGTSFRELAEQVVAIAGARSEIELRVDEPPGRDLVADIARAKEELGYEPCVPLRQGLERYVEWLRQSCA
ncbi:MAG TPA: NAD-dependent epimerase/dehydratase family protein [Chloroflexota bacterium]|jgi:nucleoside-diphosphate-sugar epimerase|nr:NAD-dependent epimerase/dehydratase family protein [Chloroflexota bacterium]